MRFPIKPGDLIGGKYRIERVLGEGGMGIVVQAHHVTLDDRVAIKYLHADALADTTAVRRFVREAQAAARIKSEHVCRVHDVVVDGGTSFMVMELLDGRDLEALRRERGRLSPSEAVAYVLQACEAMAEAHGAGIVHRDLKPANLFLTARSDGTPLVKVLDFGISKMVAHPGVPVNATNTSSLLGSPLYMSPEQIRIRPDIDARTDIWSLGVILYELTVGAPPFDAETVLALGAKILDDPPSPAEGRIPSAFEAVLRRCMAKEPADRYADVAALAVALGRFCPEESVVSVGRILRIAGGSLATPRRPFAAAGVAAEHEFAQTLLVESAHGEAASPSDALTPREVVTPRLSKPTSQSMAAVSSGGADTRAGLAVAKVQDGRARVKVRMSALAALAVVAVGVVATLRRSAPPAPTTAPSSVTVATPRAPTSSPWEAPSNDTTGDRVPLAVEAPAAAASTTASAPITASVARSASPPRARPFPIVDAGARTKGVPDFGERY